MQPEARAKSGPGLGHPEPLPLFALKSWLFPGIPLSLRVFEPRYLNMISRQLKRERGFGVVPIREGSEVGKAAAIYPYGVEVRLTDWNQQPDGTLGITVQGGRRFRVRRCHVQPDNLLVGDMDYLPAGRAGAVGDEFQGLADILAQLKRHSAIESMGLPEVRDTDDLSWQLAYLLPLSAADKMAVLAFHDPAERLALLGRRISDLSQV